MNTEPKVSVLIVTYNQEAFIAEAIESALNQTYGNLEVVVTDDGSTDRTPEIIRGYAERFPERVFPIVGGPNLGITGNCNRGLARCTGKYIALQGGDDVLYPERVALQVRWMEADEARVICGHDVDLVYEGMSGVDEVRAHGRAGRFGTGSGPLIRYGIGSYFIGSSILCRADAVPEHGFDGRFAIASDWKFLLDVVGRDGVWGSVPGVHAKYRKHGNNVTVVRTWRIRLETLRTLRVLRHELPEYMGEIRTARYEALLDAAEHQFQAGQGRRGWRILRALYSQRGARAHVHRYLLRSTLPAPLVRAVRTGLGMARRTRTWLGSPSPSARAQRGTGLSLWFRRNP